MLGRRLPCRSTPSPLRFMNSSIGMKNRGCIPIFSVCQIAISQFELDIRVEREVHSRWLVECNDVVEHRFSLGVH